MGLFVIAFFEGRSTYDILWVGGAGRMMMLILSWTGGERKSQETRESHLLDEQKRRHVSSWCTIGCLYT